MTTFETLFNINKKLDNKLSNLNHENESENEPEPAEEWIWVDGFKGTDKDMKCKGYQYAIGKQFDILEGEEIEECKNGFHLCKKLGEVFSFYSFSDENRFFRVRALVRREDSAHYYGRGYFLTNTVKLVAKSIIFEEEVSLDELCDCLSISDWTDEQKKMARSLGVDATRRIINTEKLMEVGYSEAFSKLIAEDSDKKMFDIAYAVGTQEGLSMDMKVWAIFNSKN